MSKRNYNVFFNAHTVSGIIISFVLYVIFFAGAFALFKDEITVWEEGNTITHQKRSEIDVDHILTELDDKYDLTGRDIEFRFWDEQDHISAYLASSKDSLATEKALESHYFITHIYSAETRTYSESYSLGEFLYRLHFFGQVRGYGLYVAGIVSLLFMFAIITGVIVHWKKIIPNFYAFNPKNALKRVWTEAHTALGLIGLPFQFIFALTGAYFCLSVFVLAPANMLYQNDRQKLMADLRPLSQPYAWEGKSEKEILSFNNFAGETAANWSDFKLLRGSVKNYGGTNMKYVLIGEYEDDKQFIGVGHRVIDAHTGEIIEERTPEESTYIENTQLLMHRIHYGDFGGLAMRVVYFILALITCFVIITGVLIWIEARNRKNMTLRQRKYTAGVGHTYISICLSMLPVTALAFIFAKVAHGHFIEKQSTIYWFYFLAWLVVILFFRFKRNNYFTNKFSLLSGAILGYLVPITNGIVSGNWLWKAYAENQTEILIVDILWILIATISLVFYLKIKPEIKAKSTYAKYPLTEQVASK